MDTNFGSTGAAAASGAAAGAAAAAGYLMQTQQASPTTGQTVTMTADDKDRTLILTPAGALLALTVAFPADATSRLGQLVVITSSQAITTLTASGATVSGLVAALVGGDSFTYQKVAANTWRRCQ